MLVCSYFTTTVHASRQLNFLIISLINQITSLVTCTIMQKNGAGLHIGYSCFWDSANDNTVVARWPSERRKDPNARVVCIVTVFGIAY